MVRTMKRFAAAAFACVAFGASAATPEEDVRYYVELFEDVRADTVAAVEELAWKGISDTRVYDIIEDRLLVESPRATRRRSRGDRGIGHYIRGLGFSGQEKYAKTISLFLEERAYGRPARQALEDLKQYARWNPVISSRASWEPQYSDDVNRIRNMLHSNDRTLQRLGAKCVYFRHGGETVLLDLLAKQVLASYNNVPDAESADAVAWMVKGLGKSGNRNYVPVLKEASQSRDGKVSREADAWLRRM